MIQALLLQQDQRIPLKWPEERSKWTEGKGVLWIDVQAPTQAHMDALARLFNLHPHVVRTCLHPEHRSKLKEYKDHLLMVLNALGRGASEGSAGASELERWRTLELDIIVGERYMITVHPESVPAVTALWQRLSRTGEGKSTVDYLFYAICDAVTSGYYVLLDRVDHHVDHLENQIFGGDTSQQIVDKLFGLKRHILRLRRTLGPQRDALGSVMRREFALLGPDSRTYFVDVYEHNLRLFDLLDTYRDLISSTLDAYLSAVSNRMNEVMKTLTIVSTIMLPLTLISGVFGMNFARIPMAEHPLGFWASILLMVGVGVGMAYYFKLKRWM